MTTARGETPAADVKLTAPRVTAHDDGEVLTLGFAEHVDGTGAQLLVQRAHRVDEQDRRLGQDTYCLITESAAVTYGGVVRLAVGNRTFTVKLEAAAAATLDYPRQFELQVPDPAHWELANRVLPTLIE